MLEELLIFIGPVVKGDYEKFGRFHQVLDLSLRNKLKLFLQSRRQSAGFGGKWWKLAISNNVLYKNRCIFFNEQADFGRKASYWGVFPWFRAISKPHKEFLFELRNHVFQNHFQWYFGIPGAYSRRGLLNFFLEPGGSKVTRSVGIGSPQAWSNGASLQTLSAAETCWAFMRYFR